MRHLLWKDAMTIKPLLIAACVGIAAVNLVAVLFSVWLGSAHRDLFVSIWILMPNLVALGAPALLVGSEEESGTLAWLRTLPVSWRSIVDAKLLVSLASVAITWVWASCVFLLILVTVASPQHAPFYIDLVSGTSVLHLNFFTLLLLLTGFAMAYLFRSPVTALIVLIPVIGFINVVTLDVGYRIVRISGSSDSSSLLLLILLASVTLVFAWLIQRWLGRRRLTAMEVSRFSRLGEPSSTARAYRPTVRVGTGRPSVVAALLWQQGRQIKWSCLLLVVVMVPFILLYYLAAPNSSATARVRIYAAMAPLVVGLGASWLGVLVFYGENVRRRCAFFADRGVSPTQVWWTRLCLPASLVAGMFALAWILLSLGPNDSESEQTWLIPITLVVNFSFGQLVGQWVKRPTLSLLGAPVYGILGCVPLIIFYEACYPGYFGTVLLVTPVLLFATWSLASRWLEGRIDHGFHTRTVSYTVLALLVPVAVVFAHRCWTIPEEMTDWRSEMLAINEPGIDLGGQLPRSEQHYEQPLLYPNFGNLITDENHPTLDDRLERLRRELSGESGLATHVSREDLDDFLNERNTYPNADPVEILEVKFLSIAVLLKWATTVREDVAAGRRSLWSLRQFASSAENRAIDAINDLTRELGQTKELAELVDLLPSEDLRYRSRRIGLINEWRTYQRRRWRPESDQDFWRPRSFMGWVVADRVQRLPFERVRADRFIDLATRRTLQQLETGLPERGSEAYQELGKLWQEAMGPLSTHRGYGTRLTWDNSADRAIARLQSVYASPE